MKRVGLENELESLSQFGLVSTDQEILTGEQPGEAITLSKPLTVIWSKGGERGKKCIWDKNLLWHRVLSEPWWSWRNWGKLNNQKYLTHLGKEQVAQVVNESWKEQQVLKVVNMYIRTYVLQTGHHAVLWKPQHARSASIEIKRASSSQVLLLKQTVSLSRAEAVL